MNRHFLRSMLALALCWGWFAASPAQGEDPAYWTWAPAPPMGWNSYDNFGDSVTEAEIPHQRDVPQRTPPAARLAVRGGRLPLVRSRRAFQQSGRPCRRKTGDGPVRALLPAPNRFPSAAGGKGFKPLADEMHALGLKFGIHVMRGIPRQAVAAKTPIAGTSITAADAANMASTCPWCPDMYGVDAAKPAGQAYYNSVYRLYASWDVDYVKVDDLSSPYSDGEIAAIRKALDQCGRPMVFSTSPGATPVEKGAHVERNANLWRVSDDFWDGWQYLKPQFARLDAWTPFRGPGHWPDADMIPLGHVSQRCSDGGRPHVTRFTKDEQTALMSLWAIARSPLMLGMNLPENDAWTLSLLTNDEVLAVNQKSSGNRQVFRTEDKIAWVADAPGGGKYLAIFNAADGTIVPSRAAFRSPVVTRNTPGHAVDIDVDITGAKTLGLLVAPGGSDINADHADWMEPRLVGPQGEKRLTDLTWTAASCGWGQVLVDRSTSNGKLIVNGNKVAYGIGTHAESLIEYQLPAGYTRFKAAGGLDQGGVSQPTGASVQFIVFTQDPIQDRSPRTIEVALADLGLKGTCSVRDLWAKSALGDVQGTFSRTLPWHCSGLYLLQSK